MDRKRTVKILARHSGYSPKLSREEFKALCEAYDIVIQDKRVLRNNLLAIYDIKWNQNTIELIDTIFDRIVQTSAIYQVIFEQSDLNTEKLSKNQVMEIIRSLNFTKYLNQECTFAVRCAHLGEFNDLDRIKKICQTLEPKIAGPIIKQTQASVDLENPLFTIRCFFTAEGDLVIGQELAQARPKKEFKVRTPSRRKYFHPSAMNTRLGRTLVNLTALKEGELLYDPFSGSGGLLLEASDMKIYCIGKDMDKWMLRGAKDNLEVFNSVPYVKGLICGDSTTQAMKDVIIDGIVTDPPYGTASTVSGEKNTLILVESFFHVAKKILKPDKRFIICTPNIPIENIVPEEFLLLSSVKIRIHRSLTRKVSILKKQAFDHI